MPVGKGDSGSGTGAGDGTPVFDPVAFEAKLLGEFNKGINALDKKLSALAKQSKASDGAGSGDGAAAGGPDGTGAVGGSTDGAGAGPKITDPAVNAELQLLRKQIKTLTEGVHTVEKERDSEKQARLETERVTAIRNVLGGIEFRDQDSRDLVFNALQHRIKRDENGALIAEGDSGAVTHEAFINGYVEKYPYLLAPRGAGGAGATGGKPGAVGGKRWSMADLEPARLNSMKPEERSELMKQILAGNVTS